MTVLCYLESFLTLFNIRPYDFYFCTIIEQWEGTCPTTINVDQRYRFVSGLAKSLF